MNLLTRDGQIVLSDGQLPTEDCPCCGGECVLFYRADSCPSPAIIPGNCSPIDDTTITIWIRKDAVCNSAEGDPIEPGTVVIVDNLCYQIQTEIRRRLNYPGESCTDQYDWIPEGSRVVDDLIVVCEPEGCDAPRCIAARIGYAQAEPCGGSQILWYFCKALLRSDCVYKPLPSEYIAGTGFPNTESNLVCHAFRRGSPSLTFVPPEDRIIDPNPSGTGSSTRSCCECQGGGSVSTQCVFVYVETDSANEPISPRLECCCGTPDAAAASVATILVFSYEQISLSQRILVEMIGTESGPVGTIIPVTLRQRVYLNETLVQDITFPGDFTIPICGPLLYPPAVSSPGDPWAVSGSSFDCNSASGTFERGDPLTIYEKYVWSYSKTPPAVSAPCLGGCESSSPRFVPDIRSFL